MGLRVTPPWWGTWWAYLLFALLFVGCVVAVDRIQRRRLASAEAKRAQVREVQLLAEAQKRRREDAERLSEIGKAITSTLSIREVIDIVYEHVNALMDASVFGIGIYNQKRERLEFPVMKERGETLQPFAYELSDESRPAVWCFNNGKELVVGDFAVEYDRYLPARKDPVQGDRSVSLIYLPLIHQQKAVGVITTQSSERNAYTDYDVSVLRTLAAYAAIALDNAQSYRQLNVTLNELKSTQEQLVQQEKLASLGALTAGIAHEIKNPLNFINNFSSLSAELVMELADALREGRYEEVEGLLPDLRLNMEKIEEHGRRADGIVRSMMAHARGGEGMREFVNLNALVGEYADLAYHGQRARSPGFTFELVRDFDESVGAVEVVAQEIGRVVLNLVANAIDAVAERAADGLPSDGESGRFSPTVRVATRQVGDRVEVRVEDNGAGIPEAVRARVFEPFFTTKPAGAGTGLGLSMSNDIITKGHGGALSVETSGGRGTTFIVTLPERHQGANRSQAETREAEVAV